VKLRALVLLLTMGAVAAPPVPAATKTAQKPATSKASAHKKVSAPAKPTARPRAAKAQTPEPAIDLTHALPGKALASLPSSADQLKALSDELKQDQPKLSAARQKSDALAAEAAALRQKLIATAARIETLERSQIADAAEIDRLSKENARLSAGFANDRVAVTKLLAILERLQHDMPPALAMRPGDALGAARGAMLIGAGLPPIYAQAKRLSLRIEALKRTRAALERRRAEARATAASLGTARAELDALLARKEDEASGAAHSYGTLKEQLDRVARQAADFQALLARVRALRRQGGVDEGVVTVTARRGDNLPGLQKGSLLEPVVGSVVAGGTDATTGLSYATRPNAQVIAPSDGKVLYAGPYHKSGQVLILEITTGYDLVLAGMGRVTVKPNDQLLAGEPVGNMPASQGPDSRLYFEVRHGGHGMSPAPWLKLKLRPVL
jgi:septal ring factor EnvC (AmiA/AmiB activator)